MRVHVLRRLIKRDGSVNASSPALVTELSVRSVVLPSVQKDRRQFASRRIKCVRAWVAHAAIGSEASCGLNSPEPFSLALG